MNRWGTFSTIVTATLTTHSAKDKGFLSACKLSARMADRLFRRSCSNTKRRWSKRVAEVILFTLLGMSVAGCGSSPSARFYILNTMERSTSTSPLTIEGHNVVVKVGPVSIPDSLDHLQIVTLSGQNQLRLDEFKRWGGDFQDSIQRVLAENISLLLPTDQVYLFQETALMPVDFQVMVNVREFYGELAGVVKLNADWTVVYHGREKAVIAKKSVLQENTTGAGYQAYVAAQSQLLARLSQEIAAAIRAKMQQ